MVGSLCRRARELGCSTLRGTYVQSAKNADRRRLVPSPRFELVSDVDGTTVWKYDIAAKGAIQSDFIEDRRNAVDVG